MKNGKHLIIDAYGVSELSKEGINGFIKACTLAIGMRPLTEPILHDVGCDLVKEIDVGITGIIVFVESHMSVHCFPAREYVSIDIYSCKWFDDAKINLLLDSYFEPKDTDVTILTRGRGL